MYVRPVGILLSHLESVNTGTMNLCSPDPAWLSSAHDDLVKMMALSKGHGDGALTDRRGGLYRAPAHEQTRKIGAVEGAVHICENLNLINLQEPRLARREDICDYEG